MLFFQLSLLFSLVLKTAVKQSRENAQTQANLKFSLHCKVAPVVLVRSSLTSETQNLRWGGKKKKSGTGIQEKHDSEREREKKRKVIMNN